MSLEQNEIFAKQFQETGSEIHAIQWISWLRQNNLFDTGILVGSALYELFKYNFTFLTELSICYYYQGNIDKSFELSMYILKHQRIDSGKSIATFFNAHFCIPEIQDRYISYPEQLVDSIVNNPKKGLITFTVTTCKRLDLFEKTMNSFIHCCLDRHLIGRWVCVDDNSSHEGS